MEKGSVIIIALIAFLLITVVSSVFIIVTKNEFNNAIEIYDKTYGYYSGKLMSESILNMAMASFSKQNFSEVACSDYSPFRDFLSYVKGKENNYWYDRIADSVRCFFENSSRYRVFSDDINTSVFYLNFSDYILLIAGIEYKGKKYFSWALGEYSNNKEKTPYNYLIFSGYSASVPDYADSVEIYGPILVGGSMNLIRGNSKSIFHDVVIADSIGNDSKWGGNTIFEKEVVTNNLKIDKQANVEFKKNLYAKKIELHNVWGGNTGGVKFEGQVCAEEAYMKGLSALTVNATFAAKKVVIENLNGSPGLTLGGRFCSEELSVENSDKLTFKKEVFLNKLSMAEVYGATTFYEDAYITGETKIGPRVNDVIFKNNVCMGSLYVDGEYGKFEVDGNLCAGNITFVDVDHAEINSFTVERNFLIEDMDDFKILNEGTVVGNLEINDSWINTDIMGDVYVGNLLNCPKCGNYNGVKFSNLYVTRDPLVYGECWDEIHFIEPNRFSGVSCLCNAFCPVNIERCRETAEASLSLVMNSMKVFNDLDIDSYIERMRERTKDADDILNDPPDYPIGLSLPPNTKITVSGGVIGLNYNGKHYEITLTNSGNSCPPYNAVLKVPNSDPVDFYFNGLLFSDGNIIFGDENLEDPMIVSGNISVVSKGEIMVVSDIKYDFLPSDTAEWSDYDLSTKKDFVSFIARNDIIINPPHWKERIRGVVGAYVSIEGKVKIKDYKPSFSMLGVVITKKGFESENTHKLVEILDKRLKNDENLCARNDEVIPNDPFSKEPGSGGVGGFVLRVRR